ncbi:MAG: hypothetical protein ACTSX7_03705 [Alphaproteobacteria bacterium]
MSQIRITATPGPAPIPLASREDRAGPSFLAIGAGVAITVAMVVFLLFL